MRPHDLSIPSITFVGPNGWKYSRRVADKKSLEKVNVDDRVDFTWTEAVITVATLDNGSIGEDVQVG